MSNDEGSVTCPDCGAQFDVAERLRTHIEAEVKEDLRNKIWAEAEETFANRLASKQEEESEQRQALQDKVVNQREELIGLRKDKIELEDLKENREIELEEAKAEAARQAKRQLNQELDERINERVKEETGDKELEIGKLKLQLERQNAKIHELEEQSTASHGELEGEVLELAVEETLRNLSPRDSINEVKRGAYGADVEQSVLGPSGAVAGKVIWECKKHKRWNDEWLATIRKNAIEYGADTMVIVTSTMPAGMDSFGMVKDVFVCRYHEVDVVSTLLRHAILKANSERVREQHMMTIQERVLEYVSGPEFAMVMRGIMQAYEEFEDDLRKEEQYMKRRWKARRGYLRNVIDSVTSMMGRLDQLGAGDFEVMDEIDGRPPSGFLVIETIEEEEE